MGSLEGLVQLRCSLSGDLRPLVPFFFFNTYSPSYSKVVSYPSTN